MVVGADRGAPRDRDRGGPTTRPRGRGAAHAATSIRWRREPVRAVRTLVALGAVGSVVLWLPAVRRVADAGESAQLFVSPGSGHVGDTVVVTLEDWPGGVVTLTVCGNGAGRGSVDSISAPHRQSESRGRPDAGGGAPRRTAGGLPVRDPRPTTTSDVVVNTPVVVEGLAAVSPDQVRSPVRSIRVRARLDDETTWPKSWLPLVGGPGRARGDGHEHGYRHADRVGVVGSFGRGSRGRATLAAATVASLSAGERRRLTIPVSTDAPSYGDYDVTGAVYGLDSPGVVRGDHLLSPVVPRGAAACHAARPRTGHAPARAGRTDPRGEPAPNGMPFAESSPEVGVVGEERSPWSPYDPVAHGRGAVPRAADLLASGSKRWQRRRLREASR